jgi:hypothetical protein
LRTHARARVLLVAQASFSWLAQRAGLLEVLRLDRAIPSSRRSVGDALVELRAGPAGAVMRRMRRRDAGLVDEVDGLVGQEAVA